MNNTANLKQQKSYQMVLIGLMTAILCILSPISLAIPFSPIPISLSTFIIYFMVIVLGMRRSLISMILYILLGFAGLPVFSGFTGGAGKLLGPTGGYIIGYLFLVFISGLCIQYGKYSKISQLVGMMSGTMICYLFGTVWLAFQANLSFTDALAIAVLPFLPGDILKLILSLFVGNRVRRHLIKAGLLLC